MKTALGVSLMAAAVGHASAVDMYVDFLLPISDIRIGEAGCTGGLTWYDGTDGGTPTCLYTGGGEWALVAPGLMAIKNFNERDPTYVSNFGNLTACNKRIVPRFYDTGSSPPESIRSMLTMLATDPLPNAIIGPDASSTAVPTALISGVFEIPQISYWATSASLDNLVEYPYFMRTIPTDDALAFSICKYWQSEGYDYANLIFISDSYGEAYKESVLKHCSKMRITVGTFPFIPGEGSEQLIEDQVIAMAESNVNVFLIVSVNLGFKTIADLAHKHGIWGAGTSWMVSDGITSGEIASLEGEVAAAADGLLRIIAAGGTDDNPNWTKFKADWSSATWADLNGPFPSFWTPTDDLFTEFDPDALEVKDVGTYVYDAVAALGLLACEIAPTGGMPADFGPQFWALSKERTFNGISGKVLFDEVGNRHPSTVNYQMSNAFLRSESVEWELIAKYEDEWVYVDGKSVTYSGGSSVKVEAITVPEEDRNLPGSIKGFCMVLFALNMCTSFGFLLWTFLYRKHAVVRASQTKFLAIVAVGTMLSSSAIVPITIDDASADLSLYNVTNDVSMDGLYAPANIGCSMSVWLYSMGFVLTYSSLASKIYRVKKIFSNRSMKKVKISNTQLFSIMAGCAAVDAAIIMTWQIFAPLRFTREIIVRDQYGHPLESKGQCVSDNSTVFLVCLALFHAMLLIVGNWFGYQCRNVNTAFSEGKYVAVAMVSNLQVLGLAIPVLIIVADNPSSNMFIRSAVLYLNDLSVMCLVFVPKMLAVASGATTVYTAGSSGAGPITGAGTTILTEDAYGSSKKTTQIGDAPA